MARPEEYAKKGTRGFRDIGSTHSLLYKKTLKLKTERHGVAIATSRYYRLSLLVSLITSTAAAIYMTYFLHRYYNHSPFFHSNLKMLFFYLSFCCLTYDLLNICMKIHHLALSFLYTTPCQIFLPRWLYIFFILPMTSAYILTQLILIAITVERWFAFVFVNGYESGYRKLGPALIATAVLTDLLIHILIFYGQKFDGFYLNGRMFDPNAFTRVNVMLFALLAANFTGFVLTVTLRFLSPRRRIRMSLSSKFQSTENLLASKLLFLISTIQFTCYCASQSIVIYMRINASENPMAMAYKENADFFNFLTLAMPLLSTLYFNKVKQQRIESFKNQIQMKFNGSDGWNNYSAVIEKHWN